jgi:hypothetical protein
MSSRVRNDHTPNLHRGFIVRAAHWETQRGKVHAIVNRQGYGNTKQCAIFAADPPAENLHHSPDSDAARTSPAHQMPRTLIDALGLQRNQVREATRR